MPHLHPPTLFASLSPNFRSGLCFTVCSILLAGLLWVPGAVRAAPADAPSAPGRGLGGALGTTRTASTSALPPEVASFFGARPVTPFRAPRVIEAVEVLGAERTAERVILDQLSVRPGDVIEEAKVEASRIRLLSTGFFKKVEFSLRRGSAHGRVVLMVRVEERNTLRVEDLAFGFGAGHEPFLSVGLAESNFLGRGVTVAASGAVSERQHATDLRVFLPRLSGTPIQLSASALWVVGREAIVPGLDGDGPTLDYERIGGALGIGFGPGPAQRISLVYRLEAVTAERLPNLDPPVLRRAPSILSDSSVFSTLSATWERDTRDDAFAPTRGTRLAAAVEIGSVLLGSDYEFSKYTAEAQRAFHLGGGQALVLYGFGGVVQGETPFFNQFYRRDFSRFAYGEAALPRAVGLSFDDANDYDDLLLDAGAEYTFPLFEGQGLLSRLLVYAAVDFTVTGSLEEAQDDADGRGAFGTFPLTFDAGLKLDTEIGRFTLSLAYALDLFL